MVKAGIVSVQPETLTLNLGSRRNKLTLKRACFSAECYSRVTLEMTGLYATANHDERDKDLVVLRLESPPGLLESSIK